MTTFFQVCGVIFWVGILVTAFVASAGFALGAWAEVRLRYAYRLELLGQHKAGERLAREAYYFSEDPATMNLLLAYSKALQTEGYDAFSLRSDWQKSRGRPVSEDGPA